jgi:cell wall assembly regulator SMI1
VATKARAERLLPSIARLESLWRDKRPELLRSASRPATDVGLDRLAKRVDLELPATFRALYRWHDGMKDPHLAVEGFFGWCSLREIRRAKDMLDELEEDGFFSDWRPGSWWNRGWLPFLQFNNEDYVCIDLNGSLGRGAGVVFSRSNNDETRVLLAPSFDAWLDAHVELTASGPADESEEAWIDHLDSAKANAVRRRLSPGFPKKVKAKRA